jgi:hypothetical protein
LTLENDAIKTVLEKSTEAWRQTRGAVGLLVQEKTSVRQACRIVRFSCSLIVYHKKQKDDSSLIDARLLSRCFIIISWELLFV